MKVILGLWFWSVAVAAAGDNWPWYDQRWQAQVDANMRFYDDKVSLLQSDSTSIDFAFNMSNHMDQVSHDGSLDKRFSWAFSGTALAGYMATGGGNQAKNLIKYCHWKEHPNKQNADCVKHIIESLGAVILSGMAGRNEVRDLAVGLIQGEQTTANDYNSGDKTPGNEKRDQPCVNNNVDVYDKIEAQIIKIGEGIKVSCRSACQIKQMRSELSALLGQFANFVVNNNAHSAQFTLVDKDSRAIARCGVKILEQGKFPCVGAIDDGQCKTDIKFPKDEL